MHSLSGVLKAERAGYASGALYSFGYYVVYRNYSLQSAGFFFSVVVENTANKN